MSKILFIDDEENILHGLKRMLRPKRNEWEMSFALGGKAALEMIASDSFDVIVTDMRMPDVDGLAVLEFAKNYDTSISRIVLSGQTDKEKILASSGIAHQLISKPCDSEALIEGINRCLSLKEELEDKDLAKLVGEIDSLPTPSKLFNELIDVLNQDIEDVSLNDVAEIISNDMSMSAKILQIANSPYFGATKKIETAQNAIVFLGASMIRTLALTESVFKEFEVSSQLFNVEELWEKSIGVSQLACLLAKKEDANEYVQGQSQIAGCLHELGKLVFISTIPDQYSDVILHSEEAGIPLHHAEVEILRKDHGKVGAYLMGLWGLPETIVNSVAYYNYPEQSEQSIDDGFTPLLATHVASALYHSHKYKNSILETYLNTEWLDHIGYLNKLDKWVEIASRKFSKDEK